MAKNTPHEPFVLTAKERNSFIAFLFLVWLCAAMPSVIDRMFPLALPPGENLDSALAILNAAEDITPATYYNKQNAPTNTAISANPATRYKENLVATLSFFDPNLLKAEDWQRLGLSEKTSLSVLKYTAKGGKFRQPEDIKKIWGLSPALAERLMPYVRITTVEKPKWANEKETMASKPNYVPRTIRKIELNQADSAALEALPGIGPALSGRIVRYREKLGGFCHLAQLGEVFGLVDSTYQKLIPYLYLNNAAPKKLNLNESDLASLRAHPYLRGPLANTLVAYRQQHGKFSSVEEIKKIQMVDEKLFNKLLPYLKAD